MSTIPPGNPLAYVGIKEENPPELFLEKRDPSSTDFKGKDVGDIWINTIAQRVFFLTSLTTSYAIWTSTSGGSSSMTWNVIFGDETMGNNNGYVCTGGVPINLTLPASSAVGDIIKITLDGAISWTILQGVGQQIRYGNRQTTLGGGGSLSSTAQGDSIELVCSVANTRWNELSSQGNLTVI